MLPVIIKWRLTHAPFISAILDKIMLHRSADPMLYNKTIL